MKREVWVETTDQSGRRVTFHDQHMGNISYLKRETLHESRWIPVSERMPTVAEHYLVVRLDRLDWCYCEIEDLRPGQISFPGQDAICRFTSKGVTHWLEAPPLPVEDEFEQFYQTFRHSYPREVEKFTEHDLKRKYREVWNAAKESTNT